MTLAERIARLSKLEKAAAPVVSAYLNTRWTDEHQRERTRLFVKGELRRAREGGLAEGLATALDWIEAEAEAVVSQATHDDAQGVALFACPGLGLREVIPVRAALENLVVVGDRPFLGPLAAALATRRPCWWCSSMRRVRG